MDTKTKFGVLATIAEPMRRSGFAHSTSLPKGNIPWDFMPELFADGFVVELRGNRVEITPKGLTALKRHEKDA